MDSNEKKGKRPRIGETRAMNPEDYVGSSRNESAGEGTATTEERSGDTTERTYTGGYQPRPYQNNRPYQPRPYQNNRSYNNRPYNNRQGGYHQSYGQNQTSEEGTGENNQQQGYQPRQQRPYNNNRQGGYQQRPYNNRQGGYQQRPYNNYNNQGEGGYQPRQQRPYNNRYNNQTGESNEQQGYQPRQQRPYNNNRQGGYQQRPYNNNNRQGGYNNQGNRRQGGYNNQGNRRQGGLRQNQYGMPQGGKSFAPRPKRIEYEMPIPDPNEQIRLNKFMANAGICSRREADEYIQQGLVKVNGNVVTELGTKISHSDTVEYDEKLVALERKCYILLNKPKDCVTTSDDPNGRLTVMDLVKGACDERIYPVGRLDRNTTGVLLLTNDGDLASKLTHPKYVKKKIYHVWTDKDISEEDMQRIADGVELDDGPIHADAISYATETDRNQAGIEIHSGRNRIVRRLFESLGYHVTKLDRVYFAGLTKKNLPRGRWRYLTQEEVNYLKMGSFE